MLNLLRLAVLGCAFAFLLAVYSPVACADDPADQAPAADNAPETPAADASAPEEPEQPAPPAATGKKYELKYKFIPGEVIRTEVVHRATVQTSIQGTSQTAETQSKSIKAWQIQDARSDGTVTFIHTVESIDMWQRMQGRKEVRYNSQTDTEVPPGYEEVAKAVGVPLTVVVMDNRGKIIKRQEKRAQPMSVSTQMTLPLPAHLIAVGETWVNPTDVDVQLPDGATKKIQTRQKFKLLRVVDDVATIGVDSQVLTPVSDPAIEAQLVQRLSAGEVQFDIKSGRVLSQQLDLDRNVIGFSGAASSMHYVTRFTEKLLAASQPTARRVVPRGPAAQAPAAQAQTRSAQGQPPAGGSAKKPAPVRR